VMFGLAALPRQETRTVCMGWRSLYDWLMLTGVLGDIDIVSLLLYWVRRAISLFLGNEFAV
jgi:hypothetical protein